MQERLKSIWLARCLQLNCFPIENFWWNVKNVLCIWLYNWYYIQHKNYINKDKKVTQTKERVLIQNVLIILYYASTEKILESWRLNRASYLFWRDFAWKFLPDTNKRKLQYDNHAAVCITLENSVTMICDIKNNILKFSFFIQHYNAAGFAFDTAVQTKADLTKNGQQRTNCCFPENIFERIHLI